MDRLIRGYVGLTWRHPFRWLAIYLVISVAAVWVGRTIPISMDLKRLLPQQTPSVRALDEVRERRGSTELFTIALESPDPWANVDLLRALSERVAAWPEVRWVQIDRDTSFFRDHLLLYLPLPRLEALRDWLRSSFRCELERVNPLYVAVGEACGDPTETWDLGEWLGAGLARDLGLPESIADQWRDVMDDSGDAGETLGSDRPAGRPDEADSRTAGRGRLPRPLRSYLISDDGEVAVLYAQLDRPSTDAQFANEIERRGTALIAELDPSSYHREMEAQVVGAFQTLNEVRTAREDINRSLTVALALVVGLLFVYFRRLRGLVIVVVPLSMGVSWSMALTRLTVGELNLYTMFVGSLLLGIGTDYGVHLYGRTLEGFRAGQPFDEAMVQALRHTGLAILASALTATCAFLTLLVSRFEGFAQYGVITSYGVALCMVSAWLVTPPLAFAFERILPQRRSRPATGGAEPSGRPRRSRTWMMALGLVAVLATLAAVLAPRAEFEYDFRNLRGPSSQSRIPYGRAVGRGLSTTPSVYLGDSVSQMREVHEVLLRRMRDERDPMLSGFITVESFVPSEQQAKLTAIESIAQQVNRRAYNRLTGEPRRLLDLMRDLVEVQPFTVEQVPDWATQMLTELDGSVGRIGLVYPNIEDWDIRQVQAFQAAYGLLDVPSGEVPLASPAFITPDVIATVKQDGQRIGLLVVLVIVVVLSVSLRSLTGMFVCVATMGVAFVLTLGMMVVGGVKVGMYNMIVLPTVVGVSMDGAIHLFERFRAETRLGLGHLMRTTGVAVLAASLTNASGFAGLLLQRHLGIRSIGELALIGLLAALIAILLFMPGLAALLTGLRHRDDSPR